MKYVIYAIIAVLAVVAAVASLNLSGQGVQTVTVTKNGDPQEVSIKTADILVARENIPVGTLIEPTMVEKQPWPENLLLDGFIRSDQTDINVIGQVARSPIQKNEPFMKNKLANPNDPGFLAANLPAGMKAVTVATDSVSGVAGFIFPGDRIDLLFTHEAIPADTSGSGGKQVVSEVLAAGVRVLAINVREGDPSKPVAVSPNSITLEVTDELAQKIRLAEKNGSLAFSLRSIHDDSKEPASPTMITDLSKAAAKPFVVVRGPAGGAGAITVTPVLDTSASSKTPSDAGKPVEKAPEVLRIGGDGKVSSSPVSTPAVLPVDSLDKQIGGGKNIAK